MTCICHFVACILKAHPHSNSLILHGISFSMTVFGTRGAWFWMFYIKSWLEKDTLIDQQTNNFFVTLNENESLVSLNYSMHAIFRKKSLINNSLLPLMNLSITTQQNCWMGSSRHWSTGLWAQTVTEGAGCLHDFASCFSVCAVVCIMYIVFIIHTTACAEKKLAPAIIAGYLCLHDFKVMQQVNKMILGKRCSNRCSHPENSMCWLRFLTPGFHLVVIGSWCNRMPLRPGRIYIQYISAVVTTVHVGSSEREG